MSRAFSVASFCASAAFIILSVYLLASLDRTAFCADSSADKASILRIVSVSFIHSSALICTI
ncbi:MAG: hypothetical protein IKZ16_03325, partial [Clostridia bacterium]|nr:hypothetical protein [Clostridia bacterium]